MRHIKIFESFAAEIETLQDNGLTTLYHGSKFLFDKFDITKVNTGQRSQDFGYGLYFTSDKSTATFYANELSNTKTPLQKYNDIVVTNAPNQMLEEYLQDNRVTSAKRILTGLISKNIGNNSEWEELLVALDKVQRYGYLYTVTLLNPKFMERHDYVSLQRELNLKDNEMNDILLEKGYNGIKYKINSFGLNKTNTFEREYNVVIIDDSILTVKESKKIQFEGVLKLNYI